jgi:signal transduction histidine kinase
MVSFPLFSIYLFWHTIEIEELRRNTMSTKQPLNEIEELRVRVSELEQREREYQQIVNEQKEGERLATLHHTINLALIKNDSLQESLHHCTQALVDYLEAAFARIWTFNDAEQMLELQASSGLYTHINGGHSRVPLGALKIGLIAAERQPHLTNAVIGDPRVSDQEWARRENMVAFAGYPLLVDDRLVGVVALFARHPLGEAALEAIGTVANSIALGIARLRMQENLETLVAQRTEELRRANTELQRSNQELQDFAYVASHDLQEPLRKIQAFGNLLEEEYGDVLADGKTYLDRMRNAAGRMRVLIDDLLAFSRVTTKAQPLSLVNLNEIVQQISDDLETRLQITHGIIEVMDLPTIEADPQQMYQMLQNLITNALKFHRPDTPPVVKISAVMQTAPQGIREQQCQIFVEDNGIGFDEKYLDRIFTIFQRLHGRGEYDGTGIGLAVVRKIVERHNGTVTARSVPGHGATFIVTLPIHQSVIEEDPIHDN